MPVRARVQEREMQNEANFAEAPWNQGLASESPLQPNRAASEKRNQPNLTDASWHLRLCGSPAEGLTTPSFTKHETPITNHEGGGAGVLAGSAGLRADVSCVPMAPARRGGHHLECRPRLTRSTLQGIPVNVSRCELLLVAAGFPLASRAAAPSGEWPLFRGSGARGIAEGYPTPVLWNADSEAGPLKNIRWNVPIPGLGHSSAIVWGERV